MTSISPRLKQILADSSSSSLLITFGTAFRRCWGAFFPFVLGALGFLLALPPVHAQVSRYAYVTDFGSNAVSVFNIDPNSGALTMSSVAATGFGPFSVGVDPAGRFAFVSNSAETGGTPSISVYAIDPNTGALTPVPGSPFPTGLGSPQGLVVHPSGKFLYVAHDLSSSFVTAYAINSQTGSLTPLAGSPYSTGGANTWSASTDPAGKYLFVANGTSGNIPVFTIEANTGALTLVAGSPFASQHDVDATVVDTSGRFLYADNVAFNTVSGYSIDPNSGALTPVAGSPFAAGTAPLGVVTDAAGHFLYATNRDSGNVSAYSIDSTGGSLAALSGSPFPVGSQPYHATVDPTGSFLYVTNFGSNNVTAFAINASTGALSPVVGSPFATGTAPFWIAVASVTPSTTLTIRPNSGGNAGNVTVQLFGGEVQVGATAKLTGLGPDIIGTNTTILYGSVSLTTFNLTAATPGIRNLVVTNPDGTAATLTGGFNIEKGGAAQIWVDIIGRDRIRIGREQEYFIAYGNNGNIDSAHERLWIAFPGYITWDTPQRLPSAAGQMNGYTFLAFDVDTPAGSSSAVPIALKAPDSPSSTQTLQLEVWRQP